MRIRAKFAAAFALAAAFLCAFPFCGCGRADSENGRDYGVFLSLDSSDMDKIEGYQTVVIDAQYFSESDISHLKEQGSAVYSYLNVGSVEDFRDYFDTYSTLALGDYENWDGEKWVDVSAQAWQSFLAELEESLLEKDIDGFFVDNCDVYYEYPTEEIFDGLSAILLHLMEHGKPVIINGGDSFVTEYRERNGSIKQVMTGVNQESVWSRIDFETNRFSAQPKEEREYFRSYVETCAADGIEVYLLEYTTDPALKKRIGQYCSENGFHYYISDSIELD